MRSIFGLRNFGASVSYMIGKARFLHFGRQSTVRTYAPYASEAKRSDAINAEQVEKSLRQRCYRSIIKNQKSSEALLNPIKIILFLTGQECFNEYLYQAIF